MNAYRSGATPRWVTDELDRRREEQARARYEPPRFPEARPAPRMTLHTATNIVWNPSPEARAYIRSLEDRTVRS